MRSLNLLSFVVVLLLVVSRGVLTQRETRGDEEPEKKWDRGREEEGETEEEGWDRGRESEKYFLMRKSVQVVKTSAGDMRVVTGCGGHLHIGFITMEPKTLFVPQYIDSDLILFVRRGDARVGHIYEGELAEKRLKMGDIYPISAGSVFYIENVGEGQRLHLVCSIKPTNSYAVAPFQTFYVGGGTHPQSVLTGFKPETLATAFNVTEEEAREVLFRDTEGPIMYTTESRAPGLWKKFIESNEKERLERLKTVVEEEPEEEETEKTETSWTWRKVLNFVIGSENKKGKDKGDRGTSKGPDSYNIHNENPDFSNNYGFSIAVDHHKYKPLQRFGVGVFLVNLTAGSMLAPHVNTQSPEFGIVDRGSGRVQILYPNGTLAIDTRVSEGDVFCIPRFFAFCQIASRTGPFVFFGFTTSSEKTDPQFLAGGSSVFRTLPYPQTAAALGVSEKRYRNFTEAQREAVILPSAASAPPDVAERKIPDVLKSFAGRDMFMGFD